MANVLKAEKQFAVLNLLVEGASIRATERITGVHRDTICRLVVRFGNGCKDFLDERLRGLKLRHVELDEVWSYVAKKQSRLTTEERAEWHDIGDVYLWTAIDQDTKLVASFAVGKRSADNARRFLLDLSERVVIPAAHESDPHAFRTGQHKIVLQLSSDAFAGYSEAVDLAFGPYVQYGQLIKNYRNALMPYTPSEMVGADRRVVYGNLDPWTICTSHVERHNLTARTFLKRMNRLTICFSKKLENHAAAVAMFLAYYNFCWRPRKPGKSGRRRLTPALAAGLTDRLWTFADLFAEVSKAW